MNRKEFLSLVGIPVLSLACRHQREEMPARQLLLEADLTQELLTIGSYKTNATVGLFLRRKSAGNTPQDFDCFWMICTHAKCFVAYAAQDEKFTCPCHGSIFDRQGSVLQGPAAAPLERKEVEITGSMLKVYS